MKGIIMNRCIIVAISLLSFCLMSDINAFATDKNPCSNDIAKFCSDIKTGEGGIWKCLEQHESQLSSVCKEYEAKREKTRVESRERTMQQRNFLKSCKNDLAIFCKDITPAQGGALKCLQEHKQELSKPCNESIKAMQE